MFAQTHTIAFERLWQHGKALHKAWQRAHHKNYPADQIAFYQHQLLITQRCLTASILRGGCNAGE